jgi:uncharacterized membrane protein
MTTVHQNALVADYLRRLERAAASLTRQRRAELVAEIQEHIDDALLEAGAADEVAVRNVLERLGAPEEIAAAAGPPTASPAGRAGRLEIAALVALAVPFVGWLVGIPLVLLSQAWKGRDKAIGVLLGLSPVFLGALVMTAGEGHSGPVGAPTDTPGGGVGPFEVSVLGLVILGGLVGAIFLAVRLRRDAEPRALEA